MEVYLDNSATTRVYKEAADMAYRCMREEYGNPSSLHSKGYEAEQILKEARKSVSKLFYSSPEEVYFTSGGSESNVSAIEGAFCAKKREGNHIVTSAVEHPSVLETCRRLEKYGARVSYIGVDRDGIINPEEVLNEINDKTILVTLMTVNNETGAIFPIKEIFSSCGCLKHTDAVQAFGKVSMAGLGADMISVSGHKLHAPKGIGGLYIRKGIHIPSLISGGGQERHFRSGTENMPGIAAFGIAADVESSDGRSHMDRIRAARDYLLAGIEDEIPDIRVNSPKSALPAILNVSFLGCRAEVLLHALEEKGIMVSTGSACSSSNKGGSHVLKAMGIGDDAVKSAVRFSFSYENTIDEMDYTLTELKGITRRLRKIGSFKR